MRPVVSVRGRWPGSLLAYWRRRPHECRPVRGGGKSASMTIGSPVVEFGLACNRQKLAQSVALAPNSTMCAAGYGRQPESRDPLVIYISGSESVCCGDCGETCRLRNDSPLRGDKRPIWKNSVIPDATGRAALAQDGGWLSNVRIAKHCGRMRGILRDRLRQSGPHHCAPELVLDLLVPLVQARTVVGSHGS